MRKRLSLGAGLVVVVALTFSAAAQADTTLGTTTQPTGSGGSSCGMDVVINQVTSDPSVPYSVPGTGTITQWQHNTTNETPGAPVTLVVLRPAGSGFAVVGADARNIPNPVPVGGVATYVLPTPIAVQAGDTFGLYTNSFGAVVCYWNGGSTPTAATLARLGETTTPSANQALSRAGSDSPPGHTMNLAATFVPPPAPAPPKKKCKKHKKKRSAESAKKKKCKKKKKK